jgi:hypothetical protein
LDSTQSTYLIRQIMDALIHSLLHQDHSDNHYPFQEDFNINKKSFSISSSKTPLLPLLKQLKMNIILLISIIQHTGTSQQTPM